MTNDSGTRDRSASRGIQRAHGGWLRLLDPCLLFARQSEVCATRTPEVSAWSVGEQLEHLLLADRSILQAIQELSEPSFEPDAAKDDRRAAGSGGPTFLGRLVLLTGFIPRGRGRAPDFTTPTRMSAAELAAELGEIRNGVEALGARLYDIERIPSRRAHPVLGRFTPAQWMRFAFVHHVHHAKIIRDILKAATPG